MTPLKTRYQLIYTHPLFALLLGIGSCLAALFYISSLKHTQETLQTRICALCETRKKRELQDLREKELIERLQGADPDYLQNRLEKLSFLSSEAHRMEALLLDHPADAASKKRLSFLKGAANQLRFREENTRRIGALQEVDVIQEHPVEMGKEDLKGLLAKLEQVEIDQHSPDPHAPDFLINEFELIRKPLSQKSETFVVNFNCIKREMIHE